MGLLLMSIAAKHRNRFDLNQQVRTAENNLDASRGRQGIQFLLFVESGTFFVERLVVAFDVPQITGRTYDVVPSRAFRRQQCCDVIERAPRLGPQVSSVQGSTLIV